MNRLRPRSPILAAIVACALLLFDSTMSAAQEAQEVPPPELMESCEQQSPSPGERERSRGYPVRERQIGTPIDVEWDLDHSFPKRDSVLELIWRALASSGESAPVIESQP